MGGNFPVGNFLGRGVIFQGAIFWGTFFWGGIFPGGIFPNHLQKHSWNDAIMHQILADDFIDSFVFRKKNQNTSKWLETVIQLCYVKKLLLKISQNSQENAFLIKRLWYICFPENFAKFLITPISIEHVRRLLLNCETLLPMNFFCREVISQDHYRLILLTI